VRRLDAAIPISRPFFGDAEMEAVQVPLRSGWVTQGPWVSEFERRFAAFTGSGHAVATTSCTTALQVALAALEARPGDEIIVPAFTWISTANVVLHAQAQPIFCDVELTSFNLDCDMLDPLVTSRTVGVIPVHLFGRCADMGKVREFADRHGLWVLEDAACAFGARAGGVHAGNFGDAGCFSFHPRKSITTGEGGMVVTRDPALAALVRSLRDHGASRTYLERHRAPGGFRLADHDHLGFNFRMTDLQGALGAAQMDRAAWILAERARLAARYTDALADLAWLRCPTVGPSEDHGWQAYVCLYAPEEPSLQSVARMSARRDLLMGALAEDGIATRPGTHAPVETALYRNLCGLQTAQFPAAHLAERLTLALPLYAGMTDSDQARVVDALRRHGS